MKLDIERCKRGMAQLRIDGLPRPALIEEAIAAIQRDPTGAFIERYFGIKNYSSFGDQREDHQYGFGPKHGSIVFSIGRTDASREKRRPLDADAVYLLEAYRDFTPVKWEDRSQQGYSRERTLALCGVINIIAMLERELAPLSHALLNAEVESHEPVGA